MEDAAISGAKRRRDEPQEAPEAKRIHAADLILLDSIEDADPADGDLASVMRSLEEEIALLSPPPAEQQRLEDAAAEDRRGSDLGYLLEASDDELGLPPTMPSSSDEGEGAEGDAGEYVNQAAAGFGQIWGLEDGCYDALEFGAFEDGGGVVGGDAGLAFDGGLFDYAEADAAVLADLAGFAWQAESLPAL